MFSTTTDMPSPQVAESLNHSRATLLSSIQLGSSIGLAHWSNQHSQASYVRPDHHTLSLYLQGGEHTMRILPQGLQSGGGPDKICLMPAEHESHWQIENPFNFVHLYFSQQQLQIHAEQVWDKEARGIALNERTFAEDPQMTQLIRSWIMPLDWQAKSERLALEQASQLLVTHLIKHYSHWRQPLPVIKGGLSCVQWDSCRDFIEANLDKALSLTELATVTGLSEYHFARLFKQHCGMSPHHYMTQRRIRHACHLLTHTQRSLAEIAYAVGFSSQAHFSHRFKQLMNVSPGVYRKQIH